MALIYDLFKLQNRRDQDIYVRKGKDPINFPFFLFSISAIVFQDGQRVLECFVTLAAIRGLFHILRVIIEEHIRNILDLVRALERMRLCNMAIIYETQKLMMKFLRPAVQLV